MEPRTGMKGRRTVAQFTIDAPAPDARGEEREFFERCQQGQVPVQFCVACERHVFYPRAVCPYCHGGPLAWREASGRGTIHTFTIQFRPPPGYGDEPYVTAMVELDEGVKMMSRIMATPEAVFVGQRVRAAFANIGAGVRVPVFVPTDDASREELD